MVRQRAVGLCWERRKRTTRATGVHNQTLAVVTVVVAMRMHELVPHGVAIDSQHADGFSEPVRVTIDYANRFLKGNESRLHVLDQIFDREYWQLIRELELLVSA